MEKFDTPIRRLISIKGISSLPVPPNVGTVVYLDLTQNSLKVFFLIAFFVTFQEIPPQISQFTALQTLKVLHNQLTCIPQELVACAKLASLDFGFTFSYLYI